jgi:hypothetical protein
MVHLFWIVGDAYTCISLSAWACRHRNEKKKGKKNKACFIINSTENKLIILSDKKLLAR